MIVLLNVYICSLRKKSVPLLPEATVKCKFLAPQQTHKQTDRQTDRMATKRNSNGAVAKLRVLVEFRDTVKYLKTFRVISNQIPVLLLILC